MSYILVFQNTVVGITSAFVRILYSLLFGLLLLFRLDRVVLMKGFERFDKGHKSYIGLLYLEHTLNNSVLKCFVELLLEGERRRRKGREGVEERRYRNQTSMIQLEEKTGEGTHYLVYGLRRLGERGDRDITYVHLR